MPEVKPILKPKKRKIPKKVSHTRTADTLFGKIIRSRGPCEECGGFEFIQCAHGFSRSYRAVRWDERNAFALCRADHLYYTHRPIEWDLWLREKWGLAYDLIRAKALSHEKVDMPELIADLRKRLSEIEEVA